MTHSPVTVSLSDVWTDTFTVHRDGETIGVATLHLSLAYGSRVRFARVGDGGAYSSHSDILDMCAAIQSGEAQATIRAYQD
jgi:hypothetical protein